MAGPSLEIFRFGLYMLFPVGFMLYFGDPKWYEKYVLPIRGRFVPPETDFVHPRSAEELHEALEHSREHGQAKERVSRIGADASVVRQFDAWHTRDQERLV